MNLVDAITHARLGSGDLRPHICNAMMRERLQRGDIGTIAINVGRPDDDIRLALSEAQILDETWEVFPEIPPQPESSRSLEES